jgi:hypothetical protein
MVDTAPRTDKKGNANANEKAVSQEEVEVDGVATGEGINSDEKRVEEAIDAEAQAGVVENGDVDEIKNAGELGLEDGAKEEDGEGEGDEFNEEEAVACRRGGRIC